MIYSLGTKLHCNVGKVIIDKMIENHIIEQMKKSIEKDRIAAFERKLVVNQNQGEEKLSEESENLIESERNTDGKDVERKLFEGKKVEEKEANACGENQAINNLPGDNLAGGNLPDYGLSAFNLTSNNLAANNITGDILPGDNLTVDNLPADNPTGVNLSGENCINDNSTVVNLIGDNPTIGSLTGDNLPAENLTGENLTDAQLIGLFVNDFHQPSLAQEFISSIEALSADRFSSKVTFSLTDNTMFEEAEDLYEELVEYRRSEYLHVEPRLTAGQVVRKKIRSFGKAIRRAFKLKNWRKVFGRRKTATVIADNI